MKKFIGHIIILLILSFISLELVTRVFQLSANTIPEISIDNRLRYEPNKP